MKANAYFAKVLVVDWEGSPLGDIIHEIEDSKYVSTKIIDIQQKTIDWSDDHPLNRQEAWVCAALALFGDEV